jgi:hypothetical protein
MDGRLYFVIQNIHEELKTEIALNIIQEHGRNRKQHMNWMNNIRVPEIF